MIYTSIQQNDYLQVRTNRQRLLCMWTAGSTRKTCLRTTMRLKTLRQLLLCVLLPVLAKASNICYNSTEADGITTSVQLNTTISNNASRMEMRCSIIGTSALIWHWSPCDSITLPIGNGLVNNVPFCLTTCSASVTFANNSNMQSTLICDFNNGLVNFNGTIITCMSDGAAKCSVVLPPPSPTTPTTTSHDPTSKTNTTTSDCDTGCMIGIIVSAILLLGIILVVMCIKHTRKKIEERQLRADAVASRNEGPFGNQSYNSSDDVKCTDRIRPHSSKKREVGDTGSGTVNKSMEPFVRKFNATSPTDGCRPQNKSPPMPVELDKLNSGHSSSTQAAPETEDTETEDTETETNFTSTPEQESASQKNQTEQDIVSGRFDHKTVNSTHGSV